MSAPPELTPSQASFLRSDNLQHIFDLVEDAGGAVRVNGGAVRNALLGEPVGDIDLSTTLLPQHAAECLQRGGVKVVPTGIEHGTVTAIAAGIAYEITTLREDIETDGRHAVVRFGTDWRADALRRDFTLNALYCDRRGRLFDPLGGYADLQARTVRFIGDAGDRILEDRLRILRFFRMFAWYGKGRPDSDGLKACVRLRDGLRDLSAERVWQELRKLLAAPDPHRAMLWMRTSGILGIVLPESGDWGIDFLPAVVAGTQPAAADPMRRLMAILPPSADRIAPLADRLRLSRAEADRLTRWAAAAAALDSLAPAALTGSGLVDMLYRFGREPVLDALAIRLARLQTAGDASVAVRLQAVIAEASECDIPQFPLAGRDLIAIGHVPGPDLGRTLERLERRWIESGFSLDRDALLEEAGTP